MIFSKLGYNKGLIEMLFTLDRGKNELWFTFTFSSTQVNQKF